MTKDATISLHSGNEMPVLGLGTWQLEDTVSTILKAISLGYPMIDTSSDYGTQPGIGEALKKADIPRNDIYIVTKVEENDNALERSKSNLSELDLDYIDLMLIHRPPKNGSGVNLWEDLIKAKEKGLVKDIGVSNYTTEQIDDLESETGVSPVVNQIEWSPFGFSEEMYQYANDKQIVIQSYSPLTRAKRLDNEVLQELAEKYEKSPAQILIRWNLQRGTVPVVKADEESHLEENLEVFDFQLEESDMEVLNNLNTHYSTFGELQYV